MLRLLKLLVVLLLLLEGLFVVYAVTWLRERRGRGGPMPASQAEMLLTPMRGRMHPVRETLESFGLRPGDTVLELGPGPGYFSIEASRLVGPGGRVLCVDVQPEMLAILQRRLREAGASGAHPVAGDATRLPLRDGSVDAAFLVTVLGEIPDRPAALAELRRVVKPGGVLSFMETLTDPDYMLETHIRDLCAAYGFEPAGHRNQLLGYSATFRAGG